MPIHMRGAWYFGNRQATQFLKCPIDHRQIMDKMYREILSTSRRGFMSRRCECGTTLNVTVRGQGEWETQECPPAKRSLERE